MSPLFISVSGLLCSILFKSCNRVATKLLLGSAGLSVVLSIVSTGYFLGRANFEIDLISKNNLGIVFQVDSLSLLLTSMICLLCFTILMFSLNYLDGESRRLVFLRRILATAISAIVLVCSGNLLILGVAWVMTTQMLNRLLAYYPFCPHAKIPARKKLILGRLSDILLFIAAWQLYGLTGTGSLADISRDIVSGAIPFHQLEMISLVLAGVALLKSAQFPFQGWLTEVVETPTPVSALLHAGILNSGPFFIMRFASVFSVTQYGSFLLIIVGGFTAIIGSLVLLSQPAVKTLLAYSSTAHMGFSLLLCGLGAYPAAFLHLVGHSFYKAYAFLNSGNAIQDAIHIGSVVPLRKTGSKRIAFFSFILALATYIAIASGLQLPLISGHYTSVGIVVVLGLVVLYAAALRGNYMMRRLGLVLAMGSGVCLLFFTLEHLMQVLHQSVFLFSPSYTRETLGVFSILILIKGVIVFYQSSGFIIKRGTFFHKFYIHLRNGFYTNVIFDRVIGSAKILRKEG